MYFIVSESQLTYIFSRTWKQPGELIDTWTQIRSRGIKPNRPSGATYFDLDLSTDHSKLHILYISSKITLTERNEATFTKPVQVFIEIFNIIHQLPVLLSEATTASK